MSSISDPDESELGAALHQIRVMERTCAALGKRTEIAEATRDLALGCAVQAQAEKELAMRLRDDAAKAHESERDRRQALEVAAVELLRVHDWKGCVPGGHPAVKTLRALVAQEKSNE